MMQSNNALLGVIGGLGPVATAYFMELVTVMTDARVDQEHLPMLVYSMPSIPDRTRHILDNTQPDPLPEMLRIGNFLAQQGAQRIAIPCVTAHYFIQKLEAGIPVPLLNGVRETAMHLKEQGITRVGIMATDGTIRSGIFRTELESCGLEAIEPSAARQADVMHLIFENVKAAVPADMERFHAVRQELQDRGAQAIILGCTELSLIKRDYAIGAGFVDAMEVLAQQAVLQCGMPLKKEFYSLITK